MDSAAPYVNSLQLNPAEITLPKLNVLHAFQESFHPDRAGSIVLGQALATRLHAVRPDLWPVAPTFYQVTTSPQPIQATPSPGTLWTLLQPDLEKFCILNYSVMAGIGCPPAAANGGGGGTLADVPNMGSVAYNLWEADWLAESSDSGSNDASDNADDGSDAGTTRANPAPVGGLCCGRRGFYYLNPDGDWVLVQYGSDLTGHIMDIMPSGFTPPSGSTTVPPASADPGENEDPVDDPPTSSEPPADDSSSRGDTSAGTTGSEGTAGTTGADSAGTTGEDTAGTTGADTAGTTGADSAGTTDGDGGGDSGGEITRVPPHRITHL